MISKNLIDTRKIQLTIVFFFFYFKEISLFLLIHSKNDNIEIMNKNKADEVIEEFFQSLFFRYQIGLKTSTRGCDFFFFFFFLIVLICCIINVTK